MSLFATKVRVTLSVNVMTRGPGDRVAAMLSLFRGIADEILVALDDRAGPEVEAPLAAVADRVIRYPYAEPVDRPLAWLHAECRGDWVLTIDDDEVPMPGAARRAARAGRARDDVTHYWLPRRWLYGDARPLARRAAVAARLPAAARAQRSRACSRSPTRPTSRCKVLGPCRYLDAGLYHLDTLLNSREAREAKARALRAARTRGSASPGGR